MPNRITEAKAKSIAAEYIINNGDRLKTLLNCGYSKSYSNSGAGLKVFDNVLIKAEIDRINARTMIRNNVTIDEIIKNARYLVEMGKKEGNGSDIAAGNLQLGKTIAAFADKNINIDEQKACIDENKRLEAERLAQIRLLG